MADKLSHKLDEVADRLKSAERVVSLTGAGISAESGVPTFRDPDGLWEGVRPEEVATPEAFGRDSDFVWRFYLQRRSKLQAVCPNSGHNVIARWESRFPHFDLITQNVDGLHQLAGSKRIICLHGDIWIDRCTQCAFEQRATDVSESIPRCSKCDGLARPGVVWFGEQLPHGAFERAVEQSSQAQVVLVVGTSSQVYPAASLAGVAQSAGAFVVEVNPEATSLSSLADVILQGPAGEILPRLEARLG
ncbi:MAG: NAD-dependent deacylase [Planctomycetes bacterium]|nr:NAD-dependent deacylase [Planctomycetota bacterium]